MKYRTNEQIITEAQAEIIARGNNPYYPLEQHEKDMDLIADLTELKRKYCEVQNETNLRNNLRPDSRRSCY